MRQKEVEYRIELSMPIDPVMMHDTLCIMRTHLQEILKQELQLAGGAMGNQHGQSGANEEYSHLKGEVKQVCAA